MKLVRSILGYMFVGLLVMTFWGLVVTDQMGLIGGILAAFFIIGLGWFLNHHLGLIYHGPNSAFVDMGLGVGMTGIFRDIFIAIKSNAPAGDLFSFIPTFLVVVIGGAIGGYIAALVEADMAKDKGGN